MIALLFISNYYPSLVAGEDEKVSPLYDRYLWVIRDVLKSKKSIDDMVNFAIEKNINHLFVQVRGRGDSFYESQFTSRSQILSESEFDPLAYLLDTANGKGINIHADFAAINLNFWITPDEFNNNKKGGGLKVYDTPAPQNWTFKKYNINAQEIYKFEFPNQQGSIQIPISSLIKVLEN